MPMAVCRPDGKIVYANESLAHVLDIPFKELIGREAYSSINDSIDREKILAVLKKDGALYNHEFRVKKADGTPFWAGISLKLRGYRGEYGGILRFPYSSSPVAVFFLRIHHISRQPPLCFLLC